MRKIIIILPILITFVFFLSFISLFFVVGENHEKKIITIHQGASANVICDLLRQNRIIGSRTAFKIIVYTFGLQNTFQVGKYEFLPHQTLIKVILKLKKGETLTLIPLKITFPEGSSIYKMSVILENIGFKDFSKFRKLTYTDRALFIKLTTNFPFLREDKTYSLEGFLYPDTYILDASSSYEVLIRLMLTRFNDIIWEYWNKNFKIAKLSFYDSLILASIVEKEAMLDYERPIIASVFYNRLGAKMPLASDPTIKYALEKPTKVVYLKQLQIDSPYNTYKRRGLPITPICNPGLLSFKAVLEPSKTEYLYFVAQQNGSHVFSKTWQEHQTAREKQP